MFKKTANKGGLSHFARTWKFTHCTLCWLICRVALILDSKGDQMFPWE
jgi:hypothetical protein